jgi:hypothetical protein
MSLAEAPAAPASPEIYAQVETIDPEFAEMLLGKMVANRHLRSRKRTQFANDMRGGRWRTNGEAIKLTADGRVIDGEHRLWAVVDSGATIRTLVVYNVLEEDRVTMDSGSPRTLADHLKFLGHKRTAELATTLNVLWDRQKGSARHSGHSGGVSRQQYMDLLAEHPNIEDSVAAMDKLRRRLRLPMGIAAALHYDMATLSEEDCVYFWDHLDSGIDLGERSPIRALRKRLEDNIASRSAKLDQVTLHAYLIKAWNLWREGREINQLMWRRGGANPEPFPELV